MNNSKWNVHSSSSFEHGMTFSHQRCFNHTILINNIGMAEIGEKLRKQKDGQGNFMTPKLKWVLSVVCSTARENVNYRLLSFSTCSLLRTEH